MFALAIALTTPRQPGTHQNEQPSGRPIDATARARIARIPSMLPSRRCAAEIRYNATETDVIVPRPFHTRGSEGIA